MTVDGEITASTGGRTGRSPALGDGKPDDDGRRRVARCGRRARASEGPKDVAHVQIVATYPPSVLDDAHRALSACGSCCSP